MRRWVAGQTALLNTRRGRGRWCRSSCGELIARRRASTATALSSTGNRNVLPLLQLLHIVQAGTRRDEGGWHTGLWWEGAWRLHADLERVDPMHWLPAPPDVVVE